MNVNINEFFNLHPSEKEGIINQLKEEYRANLTSEQREKLNTLIDWAVEFEQIPDQKPSNAIKALPKKDQILPLLQKWLKNYIKSLNSPASLRHAKPLSEKDTVEDPALAHMLSTHHKEINKVIMNPAKVKQNLESHQILMAIENIQGHLLEDYIASVICQPLYGFIWCDGQTIKAADFCKKTVVNNTPELKLIQIKNKYNTENSSSSKIREDTPIEIWHRLGKKKDSTGKNVPVYKWDELNQIVEEMTQHNPNLNEKAYFDFLEEVIRKNPKIFFNG
ncbi:SinI family restriction endonuclease [Priestia megaterium]|uniref:SinI family restriction endonuclease n=1 Tax=Priestia megaterium TaxID=1404 RepID=UPI001455D82C|nr:SinI family restriction endonuclease [Priestia megaterium]